MFDGSYYPKSLEEEEFENWLEKGRLSKIGYTFLLVVWDALEEMYLPIYIEDRNAIASYELYPYATGQEALIAVYDLYSEARIALPS
ncbi:hypothetical protein [Reichenbachiella sp.]|uniref:hypothetical protein n=1 Tax=Reichenbachiella sp. TaxID=2184521 RepID=UPI003BB15750